MRKTNHKTLRRLMAAFLAALMCVTAICPVVLAAGADPAVSASAPGSTAQGQDEAENKTGASSTASDVSSSSNVSQPAEPELDSESDSGNESDSSESAKPAALSEQAQAFIDAVAALDKDALLSAANLWGLANQAWSQDTDNAELEAALQEATEKSDEATAQLYAAEDLYYEIPEDEQANEEVQNAYTAWMSLVMAMHYAMDNPTAAPNQGESEKPTDEEIAAILCGDLPDAPTGFYMGSYGLPVHTGTTKIGIGEWSFTLGGSGHSYMDANALNHDNLTINAPLQAGKNYAIVPLMAQVEYPANNSTTKVILPDDVVVLSQDGTGTQASAEEAESILTSTHVESSADVTGFFVRADRDFTARLVYSAPDGTALSKTVNVHVDRTKTAGSSALYANEGKPRSAASTYAVEDRPTPSVTSGKITKIAKVNDSWLIWFNGIPAYCCNHGLKGQPQGCPTYTYAVTSYVEAKDYIEGDHYGNRATCSATSLKR